MVQRGVEVVGCAGAVCAGVCDDLFYGIWGELIRCIDGFGAGVVISEDDAGPERVGLAMRSL